MKTMTNKGFVRICTELHLQARQGKRALRQTLEALLKKAEYQNDYSTLYECADHLVGKSSDFAKQIVLQAWEAAMAFRVTKIELRKPKGAGLDWFRQHLAEFRAVVLDCAPGSRVASSLMGLFAAVGCPLLIL